MAIATFAKRQDCRPPIINQGYPDFDANLFT